MTGSRTVLVTGCTRGLGRALIRGFAARGHRVVGCGRDGERLAALARELGGDHRLDVLDLTSERVEEWAAEVTAACGAPDLLVNNAGRILPVTDLWKVEVADFESLMAVNVTAVFRLCRAFLPAMIERGSGVVVNFSSGWGRSVSPGVAPYCASKHAVEGLTRALARELPDGLAAMPVNPGIIDTEMLRTVWGEGAGAHPDPERWAERAVPFLLSLSPRRNGESLTVE